MEYLQSSSCCLGGIHQAVLFDALFDLRFNGELNGGIGAWETTKKIAKTTGVLLFRTYFFEKIIPEITK